MIDRILNHLRVLVSADSSDPVKMMTPDHLAITHAAESLAAAGCSVSITDLGDGCVNLLAKRGLPRVLFNCHLDTVKASSDWSTDPLKLRIKNDLAYGLGACDIKGAAACLLAVAETTDVPIAILLTTDEEAGKGACVNEFLKTQDHEWSCVVVSEPTCSKGVLGHRGFASFEIRFEGTSAHTSQSNATDESAIHRAMRWSNVALDLALPGALLDGSRFNIGYVTGGSASNVVASQAVMRFGFRPEPVAGADQMTQSRIEALKDASEKIGSSVWSDRFIAPPLITDERAARAAETWDIEIGEPVDFWTEAALFSAAGLPTLVLGPGSIAQAHSTDEYVEIAQLERCARAYEAIVHNEAQSPLSDAQKQTGVCTCTAK